jgi:hypothetical protein
MSERLLDYDPLTGISQHIETDEMTGVSTIRTSQDMTEILELNKLQRAHFSSGRDKWGDGIDHRTKMATLPLTVWEDLKKRGILPDPTRGTPGCKKAFSRWLDENWYFKTREGTL